MSVKNTIYTVISCLCFVTLVTGQNDFRDSPSSSNYPIIDRIVAQVGENVILHSDLEIQRLQASAGGMEITRGIDCRILEEMLYQNLLVNQAKVDSVVISEGQVNAEMENRLRSIESQIGSREKLEQFYGKTYAQIKEEFKDVIKESLMAQEMERIITRDVKVTPRDVKRLFEEIPEDSLPMINEQVALQQIVVYPKITQRDKNATIDRLERIRNEIIRGSRSFESTARAISDDPGSAKQGGLIEASRGMMVKPFEAAAFSLKVGEISEVVETQFGFHIIQLVERKGDDYTVRHILKTPEIDRSSFQQAALVIDECVRRINEGEITWAEAVIEYSEDELTSQNMGNIGNPYTGEMFWDVAALNQIDPDIHSLINRMEIGDITEPMLYADHQRRKEGVRVVRLRDRKKPHRANLKDDYTFIKKAAENRKKEEFIEQWVNENASKTYIKIDQKYSHCTYLYNW